MAEQMQPMPDVPERCPQCHSPVAERFPHAVMYDCGFSLFNDGQPVTDDYPAECQRRRIKRLEKQLAAARAEAERWKRRHDALRAAVIKADALIVDAIHRATVMYNHTQDAAYESHSDGLDEALMILRQLLAEAGGGGDERV